MAKYVITISCRTAACNSQDGSTRVEQGVFVKEARTMFEACRIASEYADFFLEDTNTDYISDVKIERIGEDDD